MSVGVHKDLLNYAQLLTDARDLRDEESRVRDRAIQAERNARSREARARHLLERARGPVSLPLEDGRTVTLWLQGEQSPRIVISHPATIYETTAEQLVAEGEGR